jgi:hypothetical protein
LHKSNGGSFQQDLSARSRSSKSALQSSNSGQGSNESRSSSNSFRVGSSQQDLSARSRSSNSGQGRSDSRSSSTSFPVAPPRITASHSSSVSHGKTSKILETYTGSDNEEEGEDDGLSNRGIFPTASVTGRPPYLAHSGEGTSYLGSFRRSDGQGSLISTAFTPFDVNSDIDYGNSDANRIIDPEGQGLSALAGNVSVKKKKKLYETPVAAGSFVLNPMGRLLREHCLKSSDLKIDTTAEMKLDQLPHSAGYKKKKMPGFSKVTDFVVYVADGVESPLRIESVSAHIDIMFKVVLYTTSCCGYVVTPQMIRERAWSFLNMDQSAASAGSCPFTGIITSRLANFLANSSEDRFKDAFGAKVIGIVTHRYESIRTYLTSFNGEVVPKLSFLDEKSTAALTKFLSECFEQKRFNCLESALLRLPTMTTSGDVENPLFILEKCAQVT